MSALATPGDGQLNQALSGRTVKNVWTDGLKLVIECTDDVHVEIVCDEGPRFVKAEMRVALRGLGIRPNSGLFSVPR